MKLQKSVLEYVPTNLMSREEMDQFTLWSSTYKGEFFRYDCNSIVLIPYHIYEQFWRHMEDRELINKMRELFPQKLPA